MTKLLMHSSKEKNCEYCGKLFLKNKNIKCCSNSCGQKKRFENPEEQEKHIEALKKYFETPGARKK